MSEKDALHRPVEPHAGDGEGAGNNDEAAVVLGLAEKGGGNEGQGENGELARLHAEIETKALEWAGIMNAKSPTAMRMLKYGFNLTDDGMVGQQVFAGEATRLMYGTQEAQEGRDAFIEKRPQNYARFHRPH